MVEKATKKVIKSSNFARKVPFLPKGLKREYNLRCCRKKADIREEGERMGEIGINREMI